jgi:hypothetical protein
VNLSDNTLFSSALEVGTSSAIHVALELDRQNVDGEDNSRQTALIHPSLLATGASVALGD